MFFLFSCPYYCNLSICRSKKYYPITTAIIFFNLSYKESHREMNLWFDSSLYKLSINCHFDIIQNCEDMFRKLMQRLPSNKSSTMEWILYYNLVYNIHSESMRVQKWQNLCMTLNDYPFVSRRYCSLSQQMAFISG